jgi:hypothetical protein
MMGGGGGGGGGGSNHVIAFLTPHTKKILKFGFG